MNRVDVFDPPAALDKFDRLLRIRLVQHNLRGGHIFLHMRGGPGQDGTNALKLIPVRIFQQTARILRIVLSTRGKPIRNVMVTENIRKPALQSLVLPGE
jgi:hypothetical protein